MENLSCSYIVTPGSLNNQGLEEKTGATAKRIELLLREIIKAIDTKVNEYNDSNFGPIREIYNYRFNDFLMVDAKYLLKNAQKTTCVYCKTIQWHRATYTINNQQNSMSLCIPDYLVHNFMHGDIGCFDQQKICMVLGNLLEGTDNTFVPHKKQI